MTGSRRYGSRMPIKKTVLTFGLISGVLSSVMMLATVPFMERIGFDRGVIVGYTAIVLSFLNPEHMKPLFEASIGQLMIAGVIGMQVIGYFWIRQVIKIEV